MAALGEGKTDCVFPVNLGACDGEAFGVSVTASIMETEMYAAIRKADHQDVLSAQETTVAVKEGNFNDEEFLKDHFPEWTVLYCDVTEDCLRAVSTGEADCLLFSNFRMSQTKPLREQYKLTQIPTGKALRYSFAVKETDGELYYILNKTAGLVSEQSVESALLSYSWQEQRFNLMDYLRENLVAVIAVILLVAAAVVLLLLRRAQRMKQQLEERMKLQDALSAALQEAEEANKAKTSFLSNMSHEIRTPMNAIIGLDSLALRDDTLSEQTRDYLQKIGGSAQHLLGLINDILDMSRIESGRLVLRREEFSFSAMLEQINTMVTSQCGEKGPDL